MFHKNFVLIPSYNSGPKLLETVTGALHHWPDVWVVIDGSTDGSDRALADLSHSGLRLVHRASNGGKGAAVLDGLRAASRQGYTHALVMDGDGQHPAAEIAGFMEESVRHPEAMVLGQPLFDATAPRIRVLGRRISDVLARWETREEVGDTLFGFRVYPLKPLLCLMEGSRHMRGYDFDAEALVRLCRQGVPVRRRLAPVRYFRPEEGGVSHFRYGRDNLHLAAMHLRLLLRLG